VVHFSENIDAPVVVGLRQGLKELGYVEGKDIVLEIHAARSDYATALASTQQLVKSQAQVLVSAGTLATKAAKEGSGAVPIVFTQVGEPVAAGFVKSLLRPGGNMTGFSHLLTENTGKRLELLKELVPACRTVLVVFDPANPTSQAAIAAANASAKKLNVRLRERQIRNHDEVVKTIQEIDRQSIDAMLMIPDSLVVNAGKQIIEMAQRQKLPVMFHEDTWVNRGGFASYGPSFVDLGRRAATYVDRILKGAKPGDLPVEQPTRFDLVINVKTAEALGLTIPQELLLLADKVIR
jgi:putative ABC transport system substrate-binding protein